MCIDLQTVTRFSKPTKYNSAPASPDKDLRRLSSDGAHAARYAEAGGNGGEDAGENLDDEFDVFLLHNSCLGVSG